jgi:pimeloyl-ACP methyl ester carboxylesterase
MKDSPRSVCLFQEIRVSGWRPEPARAWRTKPSYAILTTQDHVISPELQRWMYQRSGSKVTEVRASHAVFVSQPDAVARVIEAAAKADE